MTIPRIFLAALLALTVTLSLRDFFSYHFGFTPDSVDYALLAKALLEGSEYALPLASFQTVETQFPFGYPALLIPFVLVAPRGFEFSAVLSLAATLSSVALVFLGWRWFVPEVDERWRYPVTAMFALAPTTLSHTRLPLSDPLFGLLVLLALYFGARALQRPDARGAWLRLGIVCFFMVYVRSVGWVCLLALVLYAVVSLRKQAVRGLLWMAAAIVAMSGVVLVLTPVTVPDLLPGYYLRLFLRTAPITSGTNPNVPIPAATGTPNNAAANPTGAVTSSAVVQATTVPPPPARPPEL